MRYYKRIKNGEIDTVEAYSHDLPVARAMEISEGEFQSYLSSLPVIPQKLQRNLAAELDDLKATLAAKGVI